MQDKFIVTSVTPNGQHYDVEARDAEGKGRLLTATLTDAPREGVEIVLEYEGGASGGSVPV